MFNKAQGKDKALFGLKELTQLDIKVYLGIILIVSLILSIMASIKKENTMYSRFAVILNIFTFILLFMRLWTYLV